MPEGSEAMPTCISSSEFLSALEQSGVLPDSTSREVRNRYGAGADRDDPSALAGQ
jgi:hypothetical protein